MSQQPSILVVDDEMGILDVLRILLKGEGFEVTTAQGGKAGLEALKGSPPDIVLTDIKMPGVSGTEILAAVREQDPETPVILMTAQASLQSAIQAVNQGAFYYIQKPFSNDDLVAICRRAAEQRLLKAELSCVCSRQMPEHNGRPAEITQCLKDLKSRFARFNRLLRVLKKFIS